MINESTMTPKDAYKILGATGNETSAELSKLFKRASLRAHPDRAGGSAELMKQINVAYDVVTRTSPGVGGRSETYADQKSRYAKQKADFEEKLEIYAGVVNNYFTKKFNAQDFSEHFTKYTGHPTTFKITQRKGTIAVNVEFEFVSGDARFDLEFICQPPSNNGGLSAPDSNALGGVTVHTFVLVGTKKHKMSSRDWQWGKNPDHVTPDTLFPELKLKKIFTPTGKDHVYKRADYMAAFTKLLGANINGNDITVMVGDLRVWFYRNVFMRKGAYSLGGIYDEKVSKFRAVERMTGTMIEDEAGACLDMIVDTFKELQKIKPDANGIKNALLKMVQEFAAGHRSASFVKRAAAQAAAPKPEEKAKRTVNRIGKEDYFTAIKAVGASGSDRYWHFDNGAGITLHMQRVIENRKGIWRFTSYEFKHDGIRQNEWLRFDIDEKTDGSTIALIADTLKAVRGIADWYTFGQTLKQMESNYKAGNYTAPHAKKAAEAKKTPEQRKDELGAQPTVAQPAPKNGAVDKAHEVQMTKEKADMNATIRKMLSALVKAGRGSTPDEIKKDVNDALALWTSKH